MSNTNDETTDTTQPQTSSALETAAASGDATAALTAVSTSAAPSDAKNEVIYACIVSTFFNNGFPHINDETARIVWTTINDTVIVLLGDGITSCITSKGFTCTPLAPAFQNLKNMNQVTVVSDLVTGIAAVVRP